MTDRPFRVLGLQQIAIGGLDKGALTGSWTGLLGEELDASGDASGALTERVQAPPDSIGAPS